MPLIQVARSVWLPDRALRFVSGSTDFVDHSSTASISDLNTFTYIIWVYSRGAVSLQRFFSKGASPNGLRLFRTNGTVGDVQVLINMTVSPVQTSWITNSAPLADLFQWIGLACTFDVSAGTPVHIYKITLSPTPTIQECTYGTTTVGGGTTVAESGSPVQKVGGDNVTQGYNGSLSVPQIFNRVLPVPEILERAINPMPGAGCVLLSIYGDTATSSQLDISGSSNNGTVTGATLIDGPAYAYITPNVRQSPFGYGPFRSLTVQQAVKRASIF